LGYFWGIHTAFLVFCDFTLIITIVKVDPVDDEEVLDLLRDLIFQMEAPERDVS
jgi:hypothetical protein